MIERETVTALIEANEQVEEAVKYIRDIELDRKITQQNRWDCEHARRCLARVEAHIQSILARGR